MKMEQTECSETSAYKIQMPGNHPKKAYNKYCSAYEYLQLGWKRKNAFRLRS